MNSTGHTITNWCAIVACASASVYLQKHGYAGAESWWLVAGAGAGHIMDCDLDHHKKTRSEAIVYRIHPALGRAWQEYWYPYEIAIPHRSFWSHSVPVGTALRAAVGFRALLYWDLAMVVPESYRMALVAILVAYELLPRLVWRRKKKQRTTLRVLYLLLPLLAAVVAGAFRMEIEPWMIWGFLGWCVIDLAHLLSDL